jgi:predicted GNAT superfamily acetyltransferase
MKNVIVRKARLSDLDGIINVNKRVLYKDEMERGRGFLSAVLKKEVYTKKIKKSKYFYVAVLNSRIIGFLMGFEWKNMNPPPTNHIHTFINEKYHRKKFIYVGMTGVLPRFQNMGVGKKMYETLFRSCRGKRIMLVTSAVPYNKASEQFHLSLGFKKIEKIKGSVGTPESKASFLYEKMVR